MELIIVILVVLGGWYLYRNHSSKLEKKEEVGDDFPKKWRVILTQKVAFYNALDASEKQRFEQKVLRFLNSHTITGVQVEVDLVDRLLVASSAVIVIFRFDNWHYTTLDEVLIYPNSFNDKFETAGPERPIMGMVGTGYMNGKMILSKAALHHGFSNTSDKRNTAVHEFVHLLDKEDGAVDGVPSVLLEKELVRPWLELAQRKMEEIREGRSDIDAYGATNDQEFFAVASEYFFERPSLLEKKHPELYALLEEVFDHDMSERKLTNAKTTIGRNDPCPCASGEKYKRCCGQV